MVFMGMRGSYVKGCIWILLYVFYLLKHLKVRLIFYNDLFINLICINVIQIIFFNTLTIIPIF